VKAVLDACVLYPTVLREILLGAAAAGFYTPLWSARILEEWARATRKLGEAAEVVARGEIAALKARWPGAMLAPAPGLEARLWLPDGDDVHVLAVAIAGSADAIVTLNAQDFPRHVLTEEGLERIDPDAFLMRFLLRDAPVLRAVVAAVHAEAERLSGDRLDLRSLLRRARLPRLGKALAERRAP
jgi:predicted nucleic acid-binding protein